jgi:hypothetical protein
MNPLMQIPNLPPGKYRVGQAVRLKHLFRGMVGEVVEDRGNIGAGGRRLYEVRVPVEPWDEHPLELHEESLEAVIDGPDAVPPADGKKG